LTIPTSAFHIQDHKMPQQSALLTIQAIYIEQRVRVDRPSQRSILPERDTDPEWEALLDQLDKATGEADQTALIAEAIRTKYSYQGRKMHLTFDRCDVILLYRVGYKYYDVGERYNSTSYNTASRPYMLLV
jgi:hypothetical protein